MRGFEVPEKFTLLNLDIDSYDLYIINELLSAKFRPSIISMEINEKFPPPIYFTVTYDPSHFWQGDHFFGCSLTAAADTVKKHGYILESLQFNNAVFVRQDVANGTCTDLDVDSAYNSGYRNRPRRREIFPWNSSVDFLLETTASDALDFIDELFREYNGKYLLSLSR
jgi:hypothetical protein